LSGVPYFYPYYGGFGYPAYYGSSFGFGYSVPLGEPYPEYIDPEDGPYEGRIVRETTPGRIDANRSLPVAVQRQLAERGYYKGSIDGQFGPASREALRRFQRDKRIKQSGLIDSATLEALGFTTR
jgi:hypothetical protein